MAKIASIIGPVWGLAGVGLLLGSAVYRLGVRALDSMREGYTWTQWLVFAALVGFMAISEGYGAFQKGFSPRVAARALYLSRHPRPLHLLLAPLFCMGFFYATRRRQITSWIVTFGIIALVLLVRFLHQPWRGMVDAGVVVGLSWGLVALAVYVVKAFTRDDFPFPPEVPPQGR